MTRLEDLQQGARVLGLVPSSVATIETVNWIGEQAIKVIYRTADGTLGDRGGSSSARMTSRGGTKGMLSSHHVREDSRLEQRPRRCSSGTA